jgi:hypothetical protein
MYGSRTLSALTTLGAHSPVMAEHAREGDSAHIANGVTAEVHTRHVLVGSKCTK